MGWMVRLGESHVGRRLILMFAPSTGRRDDVVHEQAGGPGHRRVCVQCGAAVDETERWCPADGARVVDVTVRTTSGGTPTSAAPTGWMLGDDGHADTARGGGAGPLDAV